MTEYQEMAEWELLSYGDMKISIQRYKQQIEDLEDNIQRLTARTDSCMRVRVNGDGTKEMVPVITANRPTSNQELFLTMNIDRRNDLWGQAILDEEKCQMIEMRIRDWTIPIEREILTRFYLMNMTYERIWMDLSQTQFSYSYSSIRRYRDSGLERYGQRLAEKMGSFEQLKASNM